MFKKASLKVLSFLAAATMLLTACGTKPASSSLAPSQASSQASSGTQEPEVQTARLQDDFYDAVNSEWIENAVIPAAMPMAGGFMDLVTDVEDTLIEDFAGMLGGNKEVPNTELQEFLNMYEMALDFEKREELGIEPVLAYIQKEEALDSLQDWVAQMEAGNIFENMAPFSFSVGADMKSANENAVHVTDPPVFLMDTSYYLDENTYSMMAPAYQTMLEDLLKLIGKTEDEATEIAGEAMEFDKLIAQYKKSAEEMSDYTKMYNSVDIDSFAAYTKTLDLKKMVTAIIGTTPDKVIVTNPVFFENFDTVINEETFPLMKSWAIASGLTSMGSYLTEDFRQASSSFSMMIMGTTETETKEKDAYTTIYNQFNGVVGDYYGRTYFGEDAKQDVGNMAKNMIAVFKDRLLTNDWLTPETRDMAVAKLEGITVQVGYPDKYSDLYKDMKVITYEENGNLVSNLMNFSIATMKDNYAQYGKPVDRTIWPLSASTVNAMYMALSNTIVFPAAILQAPFYSIEQTESQNYGGIGAVMAHEITHAFDPNGSQFDAIGNMENWWTEADYTAFESHTAKVVSQFEGIPYAGGAVNGQLTVSENTADLGGLSCALEVVENLEDGSLEEFFTNWAVIWRTKATEQYQQMALTMDNHAPNELRANVQLSNVDAFYTTFDVKEGDGMYVAPEDRITIW